jgi:hypothetical protein
MRLYLARSAVLRNDHVHAAGLVGEAVEVFRELGEPWGQVDCLEVGAAVLACDAGTSSAAAHAWGAATAAHQRLGSAQLPADGVLVEGILHTARQREGALAWDQAVAAGAGLSLDEALDELLIELRARLEG